MNVIVCGSYGDGSYESELNAKAWHFYLKKPSKDVTIQFLSTLESKKEFLFTDKKAEEFYEKNDLKRLDEARLEDANVFIIGGGDVPVDAASSLWKKIKAQESCKLMARLNSSIREDALTFPERGKINDLFDVVYARDRTSVEMAKLSGFHAHLGADMCLAAQSIEPYSKAGKGGHAIICATSNVQSDHGERYLELLSLIHSQLERSFSTIFLLPFAVDEDKMLKEAFASQSHANVLPLVGTSKASKLVAQADFVVSVGHLAPLAVAVSYGKPCFSVTYPPITGYDPCASLMHDVGLGPCVVDWSAEKKQITKTLEEALDLRARHIEQVEIYTGISKGHLLKSLAPVWGALGFQHGLGLERGLKSGKMRPEVYDDSYYFGSRVYRENEEHKVYSPSWGYWSGWEVIRDLVVKTMQPASLLDVGCSRGWFVQKMKEAGCTVKGIDGSAAAISRAAPGVADLIHEMTIDRVAESYDVVTAFDVLEHIFLEDIPGFIKQLKAHARKHLVLNICVKGEDAPDTTVEPGKPVPTELEWMAVSGHVTLRDEYWWQEKIEDDKWKFDKKIVDAWFADERFVMPAWSRRHFFVFTKK